MPSPLPPVSLYANLSQVEKDPVTGEIHLLVTQARLVELMEDGATLHICLQVPPDKVVQRTGRKKAVIDSGTNKPYPSISAASRGSGISIPTIQRSLREPEKTRYGKRFVYDYEFYDPTPMLKKTGAR